MFSRKDMSLLLQAASHILCIYQNGKSKNICGCHKLEVFHSFFYKKILDPHKKQDVSLFRKNKNFQIVKGIFHRPSYGTFHCIYVFHNSVFYHKSIKTPLDNLMKSTTSPHSKLFVSSPHSVKYFCFPQ